MSIFSTSLTVRGQPSPRFRVEAWLPFRNREMNFYNLRLVAIYQPPPSPKNGFTVSISLEEFSAFLDGLVLTPCALLVAGDFNLLVDQPDDCDTSRFLQVLEVFVSLHLPIYFSSVSLV